MAAEDDNGDDEQESGGQRSARGVDPVDGLSRALEHLTEWADETNTRGDRVVERLVTDLRRGEGLTAWAEVDLDSVLPQGSMSELTSRKRNVLEHFRNALIFLPICLAWFDIRQVTASYRRAALRAPESEIDFLSHWTHPDRGYFQLQNIASAVAVIVLAIIVLSFLIDWLSNSAARRAASRHLEVARDRASMILALQLVLTPRRQLDVGTVESSLMSAIEGFRESSNKLRDSTSQLYEVFDSTEAIGPILQRSAEQMNKIVDMMQVELRESIHELTGQVRALGHELGNIDSTLERNVESRVEHVVNLTSGLARDFDTLGERLKQACAAAEASAIRLTEMSGGALSPMQSDG